jgi:hypothetical protein
LAPPEDLHAPSTAAWSLATVLSPFFATIVTVPEQAA